MGLQGAKRQNSRNCEFPRLLLSHAMTAASNPQTQSTYLCWGAPPSPCGHSWCSCSPHGPTALPQHLRSSQRHTASHNASSSGAPAQNNTAIQAGLAKSIPNMVHTHSHTHTHTHSYACTHTHTHSHTVLLSVIQPLVVLLQMSLNNTTQ